MKKKVTFIITDMSSGGAERVLSIIANYLAQRTNIDVKIVAIQDDLVDYPLDERINHFYLECKMKSKPLRIIERVIKLRRIIKDSDVVISFLWFLNIYTVIASLFLNKKIIISDRSDPANEVKGMFSIGRILRNLFYRLPDKIVFQTLDASNYYPNAIRKSSTIIPNPISPYLPPRYSGERKKEIVAMCRLAPQKNLTMMIDSFEMLVKDHPEYRLIIYGEGEQRQELEKYIDQLRLNEKIELPGFKNNIHEKIIDSAIFVSSSNYEGISNSMLEALGMGIPSVVTDCPVGGARMYITTNENGILVPVGDAKAMYRGMKKIVEDKDFSEKMSKKATLIRNDLSVDVICKKWLELI
ncbi:glycosyltransferase [Paenibacillus contaminans]|uniref:Glycosyltransferase family 4 protein n=1 Tax=Paenibacillus contaminans TaxID=450362 RepID=A0A329M232_9BACL|nr:glycosyltransferase [Paenibacillus contaminans]RAV13808.1 glycosyltransferase family 4 protein [Paenibacillus contaminans]